MQDERETVAAACLVMALSLAGLLLPCAVIDLALDTDFLGVVAQAMLAAFACALMVATWYQFRR